MAGTSPAYARECCRENFNAETSQSTPLNRLQHHGTIVLAGAGKMGGAMLSGWLAQGLDARRVVVIEPHPSRRDQRAGRKRHSPQSVAKDIGAVARWWWR